MLATQKIRQEDDSCEGEESSYLILLAENSGADNTTETTSADQCSRAQSSLPLATDVVRLPSKNTWNVGVAGDGGEENTEVADAVVLRESKKWETCTAC